MSLNAWVPGQFVANDYQAEQMAAFVMRNLGFSDAEPTPVGPDGGIDVRASAAIAQVKWQGARVGRPHLQQLVGARGRDHHLALLFFSASGYSVAAVDYAGEMDIALFIYNPTGDVTALSTAAHALLSRREQFPMSARTRVKRPSMRDAWTAAKRDLRSLRPDPRSDYRDALHLPEER